MRPEYKRVRILDKLVDEERQEPKLTSNQGMPQVLEEFLESRTFAQLCCDAQQDSFKEILKCNPSLAWSTFRGRLYQDLVYATLTSQTSPDDTLLSPQRSFTLLHEYHPEIPVVHFPLGLDTLHNTYVPDGTLVRELDTELVAITLYECTLRKKQGHLKKKYQAFTESQDVFCKPFINHPTFMFIFPQRPEQLPDHFLPNGTEYSEAPLSRDNFGYFAMKAWGKVFQKRPKIHLPKKLSSLVATAT